MSNVNDEYTLGGAGPDLEEMLLLLEDNPPLVQSVSTSWPSLQSYILTPGARRPSDSASHASSAPGPGQAAYLSPCKRQTMIQSANNVQATGRTPSRMEIPLSCVAHPLVPWLLSLGGGGYCSRLGRANTESSVFHLFVDIDASACHGREFLSVGSLGTRANG